MKATKIHIHNFRTFQDEEINLSSYSLLLGINNCGKSNLIDAIRVFYEKEIKYEEARDFPKYPTTDAESWIEIEFLPTLNEIANLKSEYKTPEGTFRVRKYYQSSEKDDEGKQKNGVYAYVDGQLSNTRFYGVKNVSIGKLGDIIYIPAISRLDDQTKLTGPSALRDLINAVLRKIIDTSPAYVVLKSAFTNFNGNIKGESTESGYSLESIEREITKDIDNWGTSFEFYINPITPDDLVKSLISHRIQDKALGLSQDSKCYGQGFQRHLVFTLIKLSAKYTANSKPENSKDFSPQLTWLLFEEPEAFLHPSQIDALDMNLRTIGEVEGNQVLITTHSPEFVSKNIEDVPSLIRLCRNDVKTTVGQISSTKMAEIFADNQQEIQNWLANPKINKNTTKEDLSMDMESIKYALWLDPKRSCAFFANKVLLVEGPTEVTLINYLIGHGQIATHGDGLFLLDTMGKYNMHRFMNLIGEMHIPHAVLYDFDNGNHPEIDKTINSSKNPYTIGIDSFPQDIEAFLGIPKASRPDKKPQHVMWQLKNGTIDSCKITDLCKKINTLL
jgi:putative ATP-dependent endonuclease of the OLD family